MFLDTYQIVHLQKPFRTKVDRSTLNKMKKREETERLWGSGKSIRWGTTVNKRIFRLRSNGKEESEGKRHLDHKTILMKLSLQKVLR